MNLCCGCSHGCIYCDLRRACYHMTAAFEDIEVKGNAIELLEAMLKRRRSECMLGTGSMTDPYIPLERELEITRKALELAYRHCFGFTLITEPDLVLRDLDVLRAINEETKCVVQMTLTTYDEGLCRKLEPNDGASSGLSCEGCPVGYAFVSSSFARAYKVHELVVGVHVELGVDALLVGAHRLGRDGELLDDAGGRVTCCREAQHFLLALRQPELAPRCHTALLKLAVVVERRAP